MAKAQESKTKAEVKTAAEGKVTARAAKVRKAILEKRDNIEHGFIDFAQLLSEAYHKEFHLQWGYETWEEYCNSELDVHYRKAMYYVDIWDKVKQLELPKKDVVKLGWTKMKDLAAVITEENAKEWMKKAKKMTSRELTEAVKKVRRKDTTGVDLPTMTTWSLKMTEAEVNVITEATETAKKMVGNDNTVTALELICQDWMLDKGVSPERTAIEDHIAFLENAYGGKVTYKPAKEVKKKTKAEKDAEKALAEKAAAGGDGDPEGDDLLEELGLTDDD
jgi:hypothetical protein